RAILDCHVRALALSRADLLGEGARDPQGEAVAPFHELGSHLVLLPRIYNVSQGRPKNNISNRHADRCYRRLLALASLPGFNRAARAALDLQQFQSAFEPEFSLGVFAPDF